MKKLIAVSERNYQRLLSYGKMNQSFDQVIGQILDTILGVQENDIIAK
jgi:hypothetical protein